MHAVLLRLFHDDGDCFDDLCVVHKCGVDGILLPRLELVLRPFNDHPIVEVEL